jgi:hypothetical protein
MFELIVFSFEYGGFADVITGKKVNTIFPSNILFKRISKRTCG